MSLGDAAGDAGERFRGRTQKDLREFKQPQGLHRERKFGEPNKSLPNCSGGFVM